MSPAALWMLRQKLRRSRDGFELLMGLVEQGASVVDVLRRKAASPFHKFDLSQWLEHDPAAPREVRPAALDRRMRELFVAMGERLGFDSAQLSALDDLRR